MHDYGCSEAPRVVGHCYNHVDLFQHQQRSDTTVTHKQLCFRNTALNPVTDSPLIVPDVARVPLLATRAAAHTRWCWAARAAACPAGGAAGRPAAGPVRLIISSC